MVPDATLLFVGLDVYRTRFLGHRLTLRRLA